MKTNTKPNPVHVDDVVEYFKSCGDAFACLSVILDSIQSLVDEDDNETLTNELLIAGRHVADRFKSVADYWRRELKASGVFIHDGAQGGTDDPR